MKFGCADKVEVAEKVFSRGNIPSAAEAARERAAFTARVELVPFPKPERSGGGIYSTSKLAPFLKLDRSGGFTESGIVF